MVCSYYFVMDKLAYMDTFNNNIACVDVCSAIATKQVEKVLKAQETLHYSAYTWCLQL